MLERFKDGYFCLLVKRMSTKLIDKCMSKKVMQDVQEMYNQEVENVVKAEIILDKNDELHKVIDAQNLMIESLKDDVEELQIRLKLEQRRVARYVEVYGVLDVRKYNRERYKNEKRRGEIRCI